MKTESTQSTADRLAIIETLSSYAWGYDSRDLGMLGDSFSKDASFTIHLAGSDGWGPYTGRSTIVDWLASVMKMQVVGILLTFSLVLGIAMGSSLAAGFVTPQGAITTWLNELAFVPVDYRDNAPVDEWSGDGGDLYITSSAVYFVSSLGGHTIAHKKISAVEQLSDGISVEPSSGKNQIFLLGAPRFAAELILKIGSLQ